MNKLILALLSVLFVINMYGQTSEHSDGISSEVKIEGTELARLPYAMDILKQLPKVVVSGDVVTVVGRGTPAIYVENRKVTELSELSQIPANKVRSISVITQPGAEYGKDVQSVIVIQTIAEKDNGFRLNETLRFDLTHKLSTNNELRLGWKRDELILGALVSFNESKSYFEKTTFQRFYDAYHQQQGADQINSVDNDKYMQRLTGRFKASYQIDENNSLSADYSYMNVRIDRTFMRQSYQTKRVPETRHDIGLEYAGKIGAFDVNIGNNTFFDDIDQTTENPVNRGYYLLDEYDIRSYAKANTVLGKGKLILGAEHEYVHMDVDKHDLNYVPSEYLERFGGIHAINTDHTYAVFASATQSFGKWRVEGGLRYEHRTSVYKPCDDDGLMRYLNYWVYEDGGLHVDPDSDNPVSLLALNKKLETGRDYLYPTFKVTTKLGKSSFVLLHTQSSVRPYLGLTRLSIRDVENVFADDRVLKTEKIATTSLEWKYQWANLTATYTRYADPICSTLDGTVMYNAPDYDAFDLNATLSPKVGIWSPVLNINMHKQWFGMPLANGDDKLHDILLKMSLGNTLSLPHGWLIVLDANWHGRGGERNLYYYSSNLCVNATVQKECPRQRLTFILSATNLLRDSCLDVTRYTQSYYGLSEGARERDVRMVSFSVNYKL